MRFDCLIIGHNDSNIRDLYIQLRLMGINHADFRDLDINVMNYNDDVFTVMDAINYFRNDRGQSDYIPFYNGDLLWNTILYLGSYLHNHGLSFDYINLFQQEKDKLKEKLISNSYEAVAITTTLYTMVEPVIEVFNYVKKYNNSAKIIVGGPFINKQLEVMNDEERQLLYELVGADVFVNSREGETALVEVINAIKSKQVLSSINNIIYKSGSEYISNITTLENNDLKENPIIFSLFDPAGFRQSINIRISKGCPYNCSFCGFPRRSNSYKYLDVDSIIRDLDQIDAIGIRNLFFMDDSVNIPKAHFKELLKQMAAKNYRFHWNCFFRCDQCDEEMIELMAKANCEGVFLGLESSDVTVLENMNKTSRKEHFQKTIPIFKQKGMTVFISIFTGFPGETFETFRKTVEYVDQLKGDFYRPQLWYCDPVTPIYEKRDEFGLVGSNFSWKHNTLNVAEACDLNEWALFYLQEPVWTPDPGFNFISIYYMKLRGYGIEQTKKLLDCFNNVVKLKLMRIKDPSLKQKAISNLKLAVNRETGGLDNSFLDNFSGLSYQNTERYIMQEFGLEKICYSSLSPRGTAYKEVSKTLSQEALQGEEAYSRLLSCAVYVLSAIADAPGLNVIYHNEYGFLPFRIDNNQAKNDCERLLKEKVESGRTYGTYGLHIYTHNKQYINNKLNCDLLVSDIDWEDFYEKETYSFDLALLFKAPEGKNSPQITARYLESKINPQFVEGFLDAVGEMIYGNTGVDLELLRKEKQSKNTLILNSGKGFNF